MKNRLLSICVLVAMAVLLTTACHRPIPEVPSVKETKDTVKEQVEKIDTVIPDTPTEAAMRAMGLVDISEIDPTIQVSLKYATADNFTHKVLYTDIKKAFMLPDVAEKLKLAQAQLKALHPDYSLLIYDAARPISVQFEMWDVAVETGKTTYVANPNSASGLHNYGAAVDVTIVDSRGIPISMGTPFDWFGAEAHTTHEQQLVRQGVITQLEMDNRLLLRKVMTDNGMLAIRSEWWHFELMRGAEAKKTLKLIE